MSPQFSVLDWMIMLGYIAVVVTMGTYISRRQRDTRYFFLGGRTMPAWAVACSVLASALSAATFIGVPQMAFEGDLTYIILNAGSMIAAFIIAFLFVPPIYNAGTVTIYGYLGQRYGVGAKAAAGAMFVLGRLLASGARLFMAGIGFSLMLSAAPSRSTLVLAVLALGLVGTVYTLFGGLRAVIWMNVLQLAVLTAAALFAAVFLWRLIPASGEEIFAALRDADGVNKLRFVNPDFNLSNPFTLWSGVFAMTVVAVSTYGVDHDMLQRVMAAKSPVHGGWALISSILLGIPVILIFLGIGLMLYVFYQRPDLMGAAAPADVIADTRRVFPQFVLNHLPSGLRGLVMTGLFAAAMSTFDSAISAMASSLVADIYAPWRAWRAGNLTGTGEDNLPDLKKSRLAVGLMGSSLTAFAVGAVYLQERGGQTLIDFALGVMAFALAPLLGVFCAALFTRRGNTPSVYAALGLGILSVLSLQPYALPALTGIDIGWTWVWVFVSPLCFLICILGAPPASREGSTP